MRRLLAVILILGMAGVASATDWNVANHPQPIDKDSYVGDNMGDTREGGETWGSAVVIPGLPYNDSGATCDNVNDITLPCAASNASDVVYVYTPAANGSINVSLCGSSYDCALGIYDCSQNNIACNDDFCGLQSQIDNILVTAGQCVYIVVDGFSTNCGSYVIAVTENVPCVIECPPNANLEGEPDCYDGYYDTTNGGCNSTGWSVMCPTDGSTGVMCGTSGTYLYNGFSYRDTDWIRALGTGAVMTMTWRASFPVQAIFIYNADCFNLQYDLATGGPCQDVSLSRFVAAGTEVWAWVGASQFNGIPCGSDWLLTIDNIGAIQPECQPVPTESSSWGQIKNLYR